MLLHWLKNSEFMLKRNDQLSYWCGWIPTLFNFKSTAQAGIEPVNMGLRDGRGRYVSTATADRCYTGEKMYPSCDLNNLCYDGICIFSHSQIRKRLKIKWPMHWRPKSEAKRGAKIFHSLILSETESWSFLSKQSLLGKLGLGILPRM